MTEITPETFPRYVPNPIFAGLPEYLKDPDNYEKLRLAMFDILASRCGHSDPKAWMACAKCERRVWEYREFCKKLGFTSQKQVLEWRKVHELIQTKSRTPLT